MSQKEGAVFLDVTDSTYECIRIIYKLVGQHHIHTRPSPPATAPSWCASTSDWESFLSLT